MLEWAFRAFAGVELKARLTAIKDSLAPSAPIERPLRESELMIAFEYTLDVAFHAVDCRLLHSPASGEKKYESRAGLIGHACCPQWGRHAIYCATIHRRAEIQDQEPKNCQALNARLNQVLSRHSHEIE